MNLRHMLFVTLAVFATLARAAIPASEQAVAVEFHHAAFDHYFITASPAEIADLDTGVHTGWARTGYRFAVMKAGSTYPGTTPVCRFYSFTLDTHFYSAKPAECEDVKVKFPQTWTYESAEVYRAFLVDPATGACPADTQPVYRLYNNRPDANHRYTSQLGVFVFMKGKGYIPEGDGSPATPVAFCAPAGGDVVPMPTNGAPVCNVGASTTSPAPGSSLTLNANCANDPTAFLWAGCASTQSTCTTTRSTAGTATYTLYTANATGPGAPVTVSIDWKTPAPPPPPSGTIPYCSAASSVRYPQIGSSVTVTASCTPAATTLQWQQCNAGLQNCSPIASCANSPTCSVTSGSAALLRYIVTPANSYGTGPWVETGIEWQNSSAFGGFCSQYARIKQISIPWGNTARFNTQDYGGFSPETVFVVQMVVPAAPATYAAGGYTSFAEYNGPPALRHMTLSSTPCDFRAPDPSGVNGPFAANQGTATIINWNVGAAPVSLVPGSVYYFNARNLGCGQSFCEATTSTTWPH
jgi:hypothetical protein